MSEQPKQPCGRVSYLGPQGSYSSLAAKALAPDACGMPCGSFYAAADAVERGEADCAVLPVENTLQGAVTQNLDLLYASADLFAVREYLLKIEHRLIARAGTELSQVRRIFSHQQAILQCGKFLSRELPQAELIYTESTAESLSYLEREGDAGIVGSHVRAEGFAFLGGNIADEQKNFTHFLLVKKGAAALPEHSSFVYFAASCPHEPGALVKMLQILAVRSEHDEDRIAPHQKFAGGVLLFHRIQGRHRRTECAGRCEPIGRVQQKFQAFGLLLSCCIVLCAA